MSCHWMGGCSNSISQSSRLFQKWEGCFELFVLGSPADQCHSPDRLEVIRCSMVSGRCCFLGDVCVEGEYSINPTSSLLDAVMTRSSINLNLSLLRPKEPRKHNLHASPGLHPRKEAVSAVASLLSAPTLTFLSRLLSRTLGSWGRG